MWCAFVSEQQHLDLILQVGASPDDVAHPTQHHRNGSMKILRNGTLDEIQEINLYRPIRIDKGIVLSKDLSQKEIQGKLFHFC